MIEFFNDLFSFDFFTRALLVGGMYAIISGLMGSFVVVRREANIVHSISNTLFLGFALGLLLNYPFTFTTVFVVLIAFLVILFLQKQKIFSHDSIFEISAQISMAFGIIVVSQLQGYQIDVMSYLFGSILAISKQDIFFTITLSFVVFVSFYFLKNPLFKLILNPDLALVSGNKNNIINAVFLFLLALVVALGIKIVGVILLSAFLVLPANISKVFATSFRSYLLLSCVVSFCGTLFGLLLSYFLDAPSGAIIIVTLGGIFVTALIVKKCFERL